MAASNKSAVMFEDLPVGTVEEDGPKKAEEVQPLVPQPPAGVKKVGGGTFPLLRRALHNDSAKKQKVRKGSQEFGSDGSRESFVQNFVVL